MVITMLKLLFGKDNRLNLDICNQEPILSAYNLLVKNQSFEMEVDGISVNRGEILVIYGPNGSGKTTLLRTIVGTIKPIRGYICLDGALIFMANNGKVAYNLPPERRGIAYMPQNYLLYPHLTVYKNVEFAVKARKMGKSEVERRTYEALRLVGMWNKRDKFPTQLSGGEKQRVALARALAIEPKLMLLDEPFSSIDEESREMLRDEIRELLKNSVSTALIVSHLDKDRRIGDRVVHISDFTKIRHP